MDNSRTTNYFIVSNGFLHVTFLNYNAQLQHHATPSDQVTTLYLSQSFLSFYCVNISLVIKKSFIFISANIDAKCL